MFKNWWNPLSDIVAANWQAQRVIALRLAKLSKGGKAADREARKIVSEKIAASLEAATTLATGGSADTVVRRYRSIVRANERRLSRKSQ